MYIKYTSFSWGAFNGKPPGVGLDYMFNDCQSQPRSAVIPAPGLIHPVEALEYPREVLFGDSATLVAYADYSFHAVLAAFDTNFFPFFAVLDCIVQEINNGLFK